MESNYIIYPFHHGFRAGHSTTTALTQLFEQWSEAFDLSAAFDVVDYSILLEKLRIYGFDEKLLAWTRSYLSNRRQKVYIDGTFSSELSLEAGVPQGSILGPLLYVIFTNDLPEAIHDHLSARNSLFSIDCEECGSLCCYADDSTYSVSGVNPDDIQTKVNLQYNKLSSYMANNKLVLKSEKTHMLVLTSKARHNKHVDFGLQLDTGSEIILPIQNVTLLGCTITDDLKWYQHIVGSDKSMLNQLKNRINALRKACPFLSFKNRKMVAHCTGYHYVKYLLYDSTLW